MRPRLLRRNLVPLIIAVLTCCPITTYAQGPGEVILDVNQAGENKKKREQAIRVAKQKEQAAHAQAIARERARKTHLEQIHKQQIEQEKLEQSAKLKKTEEERLAREEQLRLQAAAKKEKEEREAKEEADRQASLAREKKEAEERLAHENHRKELQPYVSSIKLLGYLDPCQIVVLPDDPNNAIVLPPDGRELKTSNHVVALRSDHTLIVDGELFTLNQQSNQNDYMSTYTYKRIVSGLQSRICREPYYGYYHGTVIFSIDNTGVASDFTSDTNTRVQNTIAGAAPYDAPPQFAQSMRVQVSITNHPLPDVRIISFRLNTADPSTPKKSSNHSKHHASPASIP